MTTSKSISRIIFATLFVTFSFSAAFAQNIEQEKIIAKIADANAKYGTVECAFTQVKHMMGVKSDFNSTGTLYFKRSTGELNMKYDKPAGNQLLVSGDKLILAKGGINTSFFVPDPSGFLRSGRNGYAIKITEQAIKLLNIKLRVDFDIEGKLVVKGIYRHNINKSFDEIKDSAISNIDHDYPIIIGNVKEDKIDMEQLKQYLENKYDNQVLNKQINGVVAAYGSNDLVGISYIKKL